VACEMVSFHPYRTWPLHIKLFTEDAVKKWDNAVNKTGVLPAGLTIIIELEGVDGKSGITGSGRQVPIDVSDERVWTNIAAYLPATINLRVQFVARRLKITQRYVRIWTMIN
ncbi:hypothetical protein HWV62_44858, partial [Athelia sp. TMB]